MIAAMDNRNQTKPIRVLVIDDSPIALRTIQKILESDPAIQVVGTARNGRDGLEQVARLKPHVVCTDLYMPVMDGLEFTREVMQRYPCPILVVSVGVRADDPRNVFDLLAAGAVDVFPKPSSGLDPADRELAFKLIEKVRLLSGVVVFSRRARAVSAAPFTPRPSVKPRSVKIVAIGASTGGPQALMEILPRLPPEYPVPVVCVQHIAVGFLDGLVTWLNAHCAIHVRTAEPGALPMAGTVYFPPEQHQLEVDSNGCFACSPAQYNGQLPSVDVTFRSLARGFGSGAVGVLLTGMGKDGAEGLKEIAAAGGHTIVQDEATSLVYGMPGAAVAIGAAQEVLPLQDIGGVLLRCMGGNA